MQTGFRADIQGLRASWAPSCSQRLAPVTAMAVCEQSRERVEASRRDYLVDLRRIAAAHLGTRVVEIGMSLCDEQDCTMLSGDTVAYSDPDHLNRIGSKVFAARLVETAGLNPDPS